MYQADTVDHLLSWSTVFHFSDEEKNRVLHEIKSRTAEEYLPNSLTSCLRVLDVHSYDHAYKDYVRACETAVLRFCLETSGFAQDALSVESYQKALELYKRKQFTGNAIKELLVKFVSMLKNARENNYYLRQSHPLDFDRLFLQDTSAALRALQDERAKKSFSALKKQIDAIAAGVKSDCYFDAEDRGSYLERERFSEELGNFLRDKYGYDLEQTYRSAWDWDTCADFYRRALLDDEAFWKAHEKFNVFAFVESIQKHNDVTRAKKVLSFIFDKVQNHPVGKQLLKSGLSLKFLYRDAFLKQMHNYLFQMTFRRFDDIYDLSKIEKTPLCYPLVTDETIEEKLATGREIVEGLFETVYPSDHKKVLDYFNEQLHDESCPFLRGERYTVKGLFVGHTFSYYWLWHSPEYKAATVYCPTYFTPENMWNRVYLIAHAASLLENDRRKCYANLFESFYNLFLTVEEDLGIKTAFQRDVTGRHKAYGELKEMLQSYGVQISDGHKSDYIVSLLDRKVAIMEESARFPVLEQLGDAVYGFALAEMMFYQPAEIEDESIFQQYDNFVRAETQVELARMLGIDKLYISSLSLAYKYTRDIVIKPDAEIFTIREETESYRCKHKFLADSLEMIVGTICNDCGYEVAIQFVKCILKKRYPEVFLGELRWGTEIPVGMEIDGNYWNRICPAPLPEYDSYLSRRYVEAMWDALNKFMFAYSLGTESVDVRTFLTHRRSGADYGDELYGKQILRGHNHAMFEYLHNSIAYMVEKYPPIIRENYKALNNK